MTGRIATLLADARAASADDRLALHEPEIGALEKRYVADCLDSTFVSTVGAYVDRFERTLERATGARHAVAAATGTAALHACLRLIGVGARDEVLMPSLTFVATANAVAYQAAVPHFVDCDPLRLAVDPQRLADHLGRVAERRADGSVINRQTGQRIAALIVAHIFGHPADMPALRAVADRYGLPLVEDAAESLGSTLDGVHTGNFGHLAALSFNGNKIVTTGGGGAILTNDEALAKRAKHLTTTARVPAGWDFVHDEIGYNYRMPNLNAALGCAQLEQLDDFVARKRCLAERYTAALDGTDAAILTEPAGTRSNYWLVALLTPGRAHRDAVLRATNERGLMTRPCWTPMHRLSMFADCPRDRLDETERAVARIVSLPSSAKLGGQAGKNTVSA